MKESLAGFLVLVVLLMPGAVFAAVSADQLMQIIRTGKLYSLPLSQPITLVIGPAIGMLLALLCRWLSEKVIFALLALSLSATFGEVAGMICALAGDSLQIGRIGPWAVGQLIGSLLTLVLMIRWYRRWERAQPQASGPCAIGESTPSSESSDTLAVEFTMTRDDWIALYVFSFKNTWRLYRTLLWVVVGALLILLASGAETRLEKIGENVVLLLLVLLFLLLYPLWVPRRARNRVDRDLRLDLEKQMLGTVRVEIQPSFVRAISGDKVHEFGWNTVLELAASDQLLVIVRLHENLPVQQMIPRRAFEGGPEFERFVAACRCYWQESARKS